MEHGDVILGETPTDKVRKEPSEVRQLPPESFMSSTFKFVWDINYDAISSIPHNAKKRKIFLILHLLILLNNPPKYIILRSCLSLGSRRFVLVRSRGYNHTITCSIDNYGLGCVQ